MNDLSVKLFSRVEFSPEGCWEYQGSRAVEGYGKFIALNETLAHRVAYKLHNGGLSKDVCVLHRCDNPPCINPDHLFLGTRDINNKDRAAKGRTVTPNMNLTHCKRGHEFNEKNTHIRPNGARLCRKCNAEQTLRRYHERKI